MDKHPIWLYKTIVVGVITIFIGVGIQPAFSVSNNSSDDNDDCDLCPNVSEHKIGNARKSICDILGVFLLRLVIKDVMLANFIDSIEDTNPVLYLISATFVSIIFIRLLFIAFVGINFFSCDDYWFNPYLQSYSI